jgi:hypothetical protein
LTAAAAIPAIAVLPAAATTLATTLDIDPIIELAERAIRADEANGAACKAFEPFDLAMMDWRDANPQPKSALQAAREAVRAKYDAAGQVLNREELGECFVAKFDKSYAAEATAAEKRAMANWRRRERAAERRTGYAKADAAAGAACHASADLLRN